MMSQGLIDRRQIRAARGMLGWSQARLGEALKVDQRQIRFWERRLPTNASNRIKIEQAFREAGVEFTAVPTIGVMLCDDVSRG